VEIAAHVRAAHVERSCIVCRSERSYPLEQGVSVLSYRDPWLAVEPT